MAQTGHLKVKNFERFQHYKDRNPPWIKLYNDLLDDYAFGCLPDASKWLAVGLWLLASRYENKIPADPTWIGRRLNTTEPVDLDVLLSAGFIELYHDASGPLAECSVSAMPETEGEREVEEEKDENHSSKSAVPIVDASVPIEAMHELFVEVLGGPSPPYPKLTDKRKVKYRALWDEHLKHADDWRALWRALLEAVRDSDHHAKQRAYQMPESFLLNPERRDRWILEARDRIDGHGRLTDADRRLLKRRRELDEIDLEMTAGVFG